MGKTITLITHANYKDYIGKKVEVEICCYSGGIMYPGDNILVGMNVGNYYFKSEEDPDDHCFWHWTSKSDKECSIQVWDAEEYKEFYKR